MTTYMGIIDMREWCGATGEPVYRDTITITVEAESLEEAISKIYEKLEQEVIADWESINTKYWECGDIEDTEYGFAFFCWEKPDDEELEDDMPDYPVHEHELVYELVEVQDITNPNQPKTVWTP